MIPLIYSPPMFAAHAPRPGALLRELAPRHDRVSLDQRVDMPEIQESFRVSFSDAARSNSASDAGNNGHRPPPGVTNPETARQLSAYEMVAAL